METVTKVLENDAKALMQGPLRRTSLYYDPPKHKQDLEWPKDPLFDNPITQILNHSGNNMFNFKLKDGTESGLDDNGNPMKAHVFDPDKVGSVSIVYWEDEGGKLSGIELLDRTEATLLKIGYFDSYRKRHTIRLESDERIVGIVSHNSRCAQHKDFQFVIAKSY